MKYIIDLDGTLLNGEQANLDSVEFMKCLNDRNIDYLVMTNSIKSPLLIQEKLKRVGIEIDVNKIMNPINAINCYLKTRGLSNAFVVGSQMEIEQLEAVENTDNPEIIILLDFEKTNVCYNKLQEVFKLINMGIPVITASKSNYYLKNGERVLDTGAFTGLLEAAGEINIEVFGKPSYEYFMSGLRSLNTSSSEVIVIGDDWKTDIKGAMEVGCQSALIKSGKYSIGDELNVPEALCLNCLMDVMNLCQYQQKPYNLILSDICFAINNALHDTIGIYLHGSLAMNCHNLKNSDIDIVTVVASDLHLKTELRFLIEQIVDIESKYDISIEISVVTEDSLINFSHPSKFVIHYSKTHKDRYLNDPEYICGWDVDPDLAAHFYMIQKRGVTLYGQQINTMFKGNYEDAYWNSVLNDIRGDVSDSNDNLVYFILNYCRTLMYIKNGEVGSKLEGGLWALNNLETEFLRIVKSAVNAYKGEFYEEIDLKEFKKFREYVLGKL